ncbi:MAG: MarR family transcriptional regulator, partial [Proteobacteria bacterium]
NSFFHFIAWGGENCPDTQTWREFNRAVPGIDLDEDYTNRRHLGNDFLQDRQLMKEGNFTGISGIPNQDIAMWTSMGSIIDRTREVLGASDVAVVEFRRIMVEAARAMEADGRAFGTEEPRIPYTKIASYQGIVSKQTNWRELGAAEEELEATRQTG